MDHVAVLALFDRDMREDARPDSPGARVERVDKVVRRGVKDGVLRETGSELYASLLMGMLRGAMMREVYGAPTGPLAECAGEIIQIFLHGARATGEPSGARRGASERAVPARMPDR